jgi:hypothetical protein
VASTVIVRRSALDAIGGFWQPSGIPYVDHPTWLRIALEGSFDNQRTVVGRWRRHAAHWTTRTSSQADPDRSAYVRQVLQAAANRGMPVLDWADAMGDDRIRLRRWADLNAFRRALLDSGPREVAGRARPLLATGRPAWWGMASLGIVSRLWGGDLEWMFRMTNRFSWASRRHLRSRQHRR